MLTVRSNRPHRLAAAIGALCLGAFPLLTACGGDDSGGGGGGAGGGSPLSDEAFCALVEQTVDAVDEAADDPEIFGLIAALATQAPNAEVRRAMERFGEVAEKLEGLDENDPDAFGEAFALILDPSFIAATETLDAYFTETCGLDLDE